jgi:hypothetical protein
MGKLVADIIAECRMQASSIGVVAIPSCAALAGTSGELVKENLL